METINAECVPVKQAEIGPLDWYIGFKADIYGLWQLTSQGSKEHVKNSLEKTGAPSRMFHCTDQFQSTPPRGGDPDCIVQLQTPVPMELMFRLSQLARQRGIGVHELAVELLSAPPVSDQPPALAAEVTRLRKALEDCRISHDAHECMVLNCEACGHFCVCGKWTCTCGAEAHNARIAAAIRAGRAE